MLLRKNYADYPAQAGKLATRHEDLMVVYRDEASRQLRARYFDSESHAIAYSVAGTGNGAVFVSEGGPEVLRYRLTYLHTGADGLSIRFEFAPPGKEFASYIQASAIRVQVPSH